MTKWLGYLLILVLPLLAVEGSSYFFLSLDRDWIKRRTYWPPTATRAQFDRYLEQRDPLLGWPSTDFLAAHADADGARRSPANERFADAPVCVSLYGDSFTYGSEVADEHAWSNLLAEHLGCRIKNYGIEGYGVDQAVLRFEQNQDDQAPLTILGFYADDLKRNLNQWHFLLNGVDDHKWSFKPVFQNDDSMKLQDIPIDSYRLVLDTFEEPRQTLLHDRYLPNEPLLLASISVSFPYTRSSFLLARRIITEIDFSRLSLSARLRELNYPLWYDTPDGPTPESISLNARIVERFADRCTSMDKACVVLVIPDLDSIRAYQGRGADLLNPVVEPFKASITTWEALTHFSRATEPQGLCHYIGRERNCIGHFNRDGYALLADFVAEQIRQRTRDVVSGHP